MKFSIAYYPRVTFQSKEFLLFEALYCAGLDCIHCGNNFLTSSSAEFCIVDAAIFEEYKLTTTQP